MNGSVDLKTAADTLVPGTNYIRYIIPVSGDCLSDTSLIILKTDSLPIMISCASAVHHSVDVGLMGYMEETTELDPVVTKDGCSGYTLYNSFNNKATLDSAYFSLDEKSIISYPVMWIAYDPFTHSDTCYTTLSIGTFKIPNMFTPNGDLVNDTWVFSLDKTPGARVTVYNRWGNKVWEGYGSINWDGVMTNGEKAPSDGYQFLITFEGKIIYKGTVTIIR
jgi:gliding motility-associated-like protein